MQDDRLERPWQLKDSGQHYKRRFSKTADVVAYARWHALTAMKSHSGNIPEQLDIPAIELGRIVDAPYCQ